MKAPIFYRIAAVLLLLFAAGHTLGFRQSDPTWGVDALLGLMRSIHFDVQGVSRTYWGPLRRGGVLGRGILSVRGGISVAVRRPSGRDFGNHARDRVGSRPLFCRHHVSELEVPLSSPCRLFNGDYSVFNCGGVAVSENKLKLFVRVRRNRSGKSSPPSDCRYSTSLGECPHRN